MAGELWVSVFSLAGVALGGGLTAFTQRATQRSTERIDGRRQAVATAEARRTEQVQAIKDFIACAQKAERAAYNRPGSWGEDEDGWMTRAQAVMTELWIAERAVVLLCAPVLHSPIHEYGRSLNQAVWQEIGDSEVNAHLDEHKTAFMTAARTALSSAQE